MPGSISAKYLTWRPRKQVTSQILMWSVSIWLPTQLGLSQNLPSFLSCSNLSHQHLSPGAFILESISSFFLSCPPDLSFCRLEESSMGVGKCWLKQAMSIEIYFYIFAPNGSEILCLLLSVILRSLSSQHLERLKLWISLFNLKWVIKLSLLSHLLMEKFF